MRHFVFENSCWCDFVFGTRFWLCEDVFCKAMKLMQCMFEESDQMHSIINASSSLSIHWS
jgi:hypothetical protein